MHTYTYKIIDITTDHLKTRTQASVRMLYTPTLNIPHHNVGIMTIYIFSNIHLITFYFKVHIFELW
jgi:hypothetical protein